MHADRAGSGDGSGRSARARSDALSRRGEICNTQSSHSGSGKPSVLLRVGAGGVIRPGIPPCAFAASRAQCLTRGSDLDSSVKLQDGERSG